MPLKLDLKCGEKMIVNGAVLENVGPNAKILIHNMAAILREKEILTQEDAATPASRVYFAIQCAYMFPSAREDHLTSFHGLLKDYVTACPSADDISDSITAHVDAGEYYKALRAARNLVAHEVRTLSDFNSGMSKLIEIAADVDQEVSAPTEGEDAQ